MPLSPYDRERMKPSIDQMERDAEQDVLEFAQSLDKRPGDTRQA
jgi:hypothetical protein